MKINVANPATGCQKQYEVDDESRLRALYDKRLSQEIDGEALFGEEFRGTVLRINGAQDKEGFPARLGVLTPNRVRLLMHKGDVGCRGYGMRDGERKRRSVRGCIISGEMSVVNLVIVRQGDNDIPGLTDKMIPRRLGPKRASRIRKLFNLSKEDDVRKYVIRRKVVTKSGKTYEKAPKIQRLVTALTLQRKRRRRAAKRDRAMRSKAEAAEYEKLLAQRQAEARRIRKESRSRRSTKRESMAGGT
ncbi:hypothetical protein CDCA_CDCA01G0052 [Cyanidium caldarium]|uniref:40S ribosomal protein S6 n=1 Tax=Cyanidium caldarium TaxID=2771 RepID=A0AAV9INU9_CYACA|nr:hypothetical protein CDCA_CDCA01G0052 [Cyanidium caldarium]